MEKQIYTTKEIPFSYYEYSGYRIEIDITDSRRVFQRHVWIRNSGIVEKDDWIDSSHNNCIANDELIRKLVHRGYFKI